MDWLNKIGSLKLKWNGFGWILIEALRLGDIALVDFV